MATPSTLRLVHPEPGFVREPQVAESRVRRFFHRKARRREVVPGWREEAIFRAITRTGA
jgi:hypothetical protein